jgi:hypothetical protein
MRKTIPSSGDEPTFSEWLEKEMDWRPFGFHTYWKDGFHIDSPKEKIKIKIGGPIMVDGGGIRAEQVF